MVPNMATKKKLLLSGLPDVSMETQQYQDRKLKLVFKLFMAFSHGPPSPHKALLYLKYGKEDFRVQGTKRCYNESPIGYLEVAVSAQ